MLPEYITEYALALKEGKVRPAVTMVIDFDTEALGHCQYSYGANPGG